jgi:hypothetical protein
MGAVFDTMSGHMKSFQAPRKEKMARAESAGMTRGIMMRL